MHRDEARRGTVWLGWARIGLGVIAVIAPRVPLVPWVGDAESRRPEAKLLARALGARDIALGLGPVLALRHGTPARGWVEAGGLADAGDLLGTVVAWRSLPRRTRWVMLAVIGGSTVASGVLATALE